MIYINNTGVSHSHNHNHTTHHPHPTYIIRHRLLGRVELDVVRTTRRRVHKATGDTLDQHRVGHRQLEHVVDLGALLGQHLIKLHTHTHKQQVVRHTTASSSSSHILPYHLSLAHRAREAIEDEALGAVGTRQVVADDVHHNIITDQT